MTIPEDLRYTNDHEWVRREGARVVVGITDFAQSALGDVVHVDRPTLGLFVAEGDSVGEIESTKSVSELYAPVAGTIVAVNEAVEFHPELLNTDPYGEGWIVVIEFASSDAYESLLSPLAYSSVVVAAEGA